MVWGLGCPVQGWEFDFNAPCGSLPAQGILWFCVCSGGHHNTWHWKNHAAPWLFEMLLLAAVILGYRSCEGLGSKSILPVLWGLHSKFPQAVVH